VVKTDSPVDDPGQYTESLFNFPDNGSEDPTDARTSAVKDNRDSKRSSKLKRQAKRTSTANNNA
jgi:hypothetical protein